MRNIRALLLSRNHSHSGQHPTTETSEGILNGQIQIWLFWLDWSNGDCGDFIFLVSIFFFFFFFFFLCFQVASYSSFSPESISVLYFASSSLLSPSLSLSLLLFFSTFHVKVETRLLGKRSAAFTFTFEKRAALKEDKTSILIKR